MSDLPYFVVDAFTDRAFSGNPAAVVPLERWLPDATMLSIAAELALSETAFFVREADTFSLRWFTPVVEVELCGHGTIATSFVLMNKLEPARNEVTFQSLSGPLGVSRAGDVLTLDFPSRPAAPEPEPQVRDQVAAALGKRPRELWRARDLVAVYDSADDVRRLAPDFVKMKTIDVHAVIATAPGDRGADFVSRFFAPIQGIDEDPVTGSAHCTLTPMWAAKLGKRELVAHQVSKRGGVLACKLAGDRVQIGGRAVLVASGVLHL
jgi:PhzF family phenazine biosynthesis protein